MICRISLEQLAPAILYNLTLSTPLGPCLPGGWSTAAPRFMVHKHSIGAIDIAVASGHRPQAKIDVVVRDMQMIRIQATQLSKQLAPDHQHSPSNGREVVANLYAALVARMFVLHVFVTVTSHTANPKDHARMLKATVWIEKLGAYTADFRSKCLASHLLQPSLFDGLNIIIEQQQKLAIGLRRCGIV